MTVRRSLVAIMALFIACSTLQGCGSSSGTRQAVRTSAAIQDVSDELTSTAEQIDATFAALDNLTGQTGGNLTRGYDRFVRELGRLETSTERVEARAEDMRRRAASYHEAWEAQLANVSSSTIRDLSAEQRELAMQRIESVQAQLDAAKEAADPMLTELNDIRKFLEFNLNPSGVQSIQPIAAQARRDADRVKTSLAAVAEMLAEFGTEMSPRQ